MADFRRRHRQNPPAPQPHRHRQRCCQLGRPKPHARRGQYRPSPIPDSDGDALPDTWEIANGLNRFNAADALLDADGDGRTNAAEYLAATDPNNGASFLAATVTQPAVDAFSIQFTARAGRSYTIQWRTDLTTGTWQKLTDIAAPSVDTPVSFNDTAPDPHRFYRIVTPATP